MSRSLSVFLPVHNLQDGLERLILDVLEVIPELTGTFSVLVIDDGSSDETAEAAADLSRCFPQVLAARHPSRLGLAASLRTGLLLTKGELVLVRAENCRLDMHEVHKLWHALGNSGALVGCGEQLVHTDVGPNPADGLRSDTGTADLVLARRGLLEQVCREWTDGVSLPQVLRRLDPCHRVVRLPRAFIRLKRRAPTS